VKFITLRRCFVMIAIVLLITACTPSEAATKEAPESLANGVQQVGGIVLNGGDTTSEGLMDAPRTFIYQVKLDSGEEIKVSYTSYPPSPVSDSLTKLKLTFYAGEIKVGDYLTAHGLYDQVTQTLTVAAEGDFIETFGKKP